MSTLAYTKKAFQTFSGIGREIAEKIVNTDLGSALKNEELLRRILISSRLEVDDSAFALLAQGFGFEIWSKELEYIVADEAFLYATSYTIADLISRPWGELFSRDSDMLKKIYNSFLVCINTNKPVRNVAPLHEVCEVEGEKRKMLVSIEAFFPLTDANNEVRAFVAVTQLQAK